ncbi:SNF2 family N-terminal domain-containing protein [Gongronella butleri]|nr:SNF2 family N-terminal domain-containing protein [Gongronella butleri]
MPAYQYYKGGSSSTSASTSSSSSPASSARPISMHALSQYDDRPKRNARKKVNSYYADDFDQDDEEDEIEEDEEDDDDPMDLDDDELSEDDDDDPIVDDQDDGYGDDSDFEAAPKRSRKPRLPDQQQQQADQGVFIPMGAKVFEKILSMRTNETTGKDELLIKYKHTSFRRAEWVTVEQIEGEHLGKHRVKRFMQKLHHDGQVNEDFSEHHKVDRIIDEGELTDPLTGETKVYYLVKWMGLLYDASTWEPEVDMQQIDAAKIQEFHARRQIPQEKLAAAPARPSIDQFTQYTNSIKYRYGNELRQYQLEGLNWLRFCYFHRRSCILADEMGLGKTVQSVTFLNDIYHTIGIRGPFLIVAPLSTVPHWERAFRAWTDLNVVDFRGNANARSLLLETEFHYKDMQGKNIPNTYKFDVLITTYEMAIASASQLRSVPWKAAVFDEAHRLKNKQSKVGEILKMFKIDHKLLLTGTPLQNNLDELYSLLSFMQPDVFNDEKQFFAEYGALQTASQVEKLQGLLKPIMLRRFKEDVEKSIPVKEETVIEVELTSAQKKWYRAVLERNFSFLKKGNKTNKEMPQLRNIVMQLRKVCIHPFLLEGAEETIVSDAKAVTAQEQFELLVQASGKLVLIDKLLRKLIKGNHKVLIFSQFTSCLDILADYLRGRNYAHERIDGSIPGEQRQAAIDRFSTLPIEQSFVFLLCTRAGGVGINLTAADTCIIFDSDWNPQNDLQAQARCHRIGQTKPVQIYRLICANTYEKDMFDRAGMKLGLDKAVMQRTSADTNVAANGSPAKSELSKKEIEDLLKKGAYGAMLDDEASTKFCEEDIDQILERRTTVIRHEGNEKGSVFSKATFSATEKSEAVELDDPDFWDKWAAQANIDTTEIPEDQDLIMFQPRRRRQVQRFGVADDEPMSGEDADPDSDAYEEADGNSVARSSGARRTGDTPQLWTASEKTKFERKIMIYGYGAWDQFAAHFSRRSPADLRAVARSLIRQCIPQVGKNNEEDRKLHEDIEDILLLDDRSEISEDATIPYPDASKKQIAEFRSFLLEAPQEYVDHVERKGRNLLLRIQMLYLVRDRIVPKDWEEAKHLPIPKVTGSPPSDWWGDDEDRDLLLGIVKHGYQQYLTTRNDPEFHFYGKKFDDSNGGVDDDDEQQQQQPAQADDGPESDGRVYMWPSKADIGIRIRRVIAAFLREEASDLRRRRQEESTFSDESRMERLRQREERVRLRRFGGHNRWHKRNRADFLRTVLSFGIETVASDDRIRWDRFRELSGLEGRPDDVMDAYYDRFLRACKEIVKRAEANQTNANATQLDQPAASVASGGVGGDHDTPMMSRESSMEPSAHTNGQPASDVASTDTPAAATTTATTNNDQPAADSEPAIDQEDLDLVPYDKARRSLKRIAQMKRIREVVMVHPEFEEKLIAARKTSGLPTWWRVPEHDRALLQAICKHGYGRSDLVLADKQLAFTSAVQEIIKEHAIQDPESAEGNTILMEKLNWPKDIVLARRIDSLCELITKPRPAPVVSASSMGSQGRRAGGAGRSSGTKRVHDGSGGRQGRVKVKKLTLNGPMMHSVSSDELDNSSDEELDDGDTMRVSSDALLSELRRRRRQIREAMPLSDDEDELDDDDTHHVRASSTASSSMLSTILDNYDSGEDTDDILREAGSRVNSSNKKKKKTSRRRVNRAAVAASYKAYLDWKRHYILENKAAKNRQHAAAAAAATKAANAASHQLQRRSSIVSTASSAMSSVHDTEAIVPPTNSSQNTQNTQNIDASAPSTTTTTPQPASTSNLLNDDDTESVY